MKNNGCPNFSDLHFLRSKNLIELFSSSHIHFFSDPKVLCSFVILKFLKINFSVYCLFFKNFIS